MGGARESGALWQVEHEVTAADDAVEGAEGMAVGSGEMVEEERMVVREEPEEGEEVEPLEGEEVIQIGEEQVIQLGEEGVIRLGENGLLQLGGEVIQLGDEGAIQFGEEEVLRIGEDGTLSGSVLRLREEEVQVTLPGLKVVRRAR